MAANGKVTYAKEIITPDTAKQWLEKNTQNRSLRWPYVIRLASVLQRGEWIFNGAPIVFDSNGRLLDGQHRLAACVESGVSIVSLVVRGTTSEAFLTIDLGIPRRYSDALHIEGNANASYLATMINLMFWYEHSNPCGRFMVNAGGLKASMQQLEHYRVRNPTVTAYMASRWPHTAKTRGLPVSWGGIIWHAFERSGCGFEKADEFFSILAGEAQSTRNHPARMLVERFVRAKVDRHQLRPNESLTFCIRSFNAFRANRTLDKMVGDIAAETPSFDGWLRGKYWS